MSPRTVGLTTSALAAHPDPLRATVARFAADVAGAERPVHRSRQREGGAVAARESLDLDQPYWRAAFAGAWIVYARTRPANQRAGMLTMIERAEEDHRERGDPLPTFLLDVREAMMRDDPRKEQRDEFLARAMGDALLPRLAADGSRQAMRRWLDELEAVHRDSGIEPHDWIARARRMHLGE